MLLSQRPQRKSSLRIFSALLLTHINFHPHFHFFFSLSQLLQNISQVPKASAVAFTEPSSPLTHSRFRWYPWYLSPWSDLLQLSSHMEHAEPVSNPHWRPHSFLHQLLLRHPLHLPCRQSSHTHAHTYTVWLHLNLPLLCCHRSLTARLLNT